MQTFSEIRPLEHFFLVNRTVDKPSTRLTRLTKFFKNGNRVNRVNRKKSVSVDKENTDYQTITLFVNRVNRIFYKKRYRHIYTHKRA